MERISEYRIMWIFVFFDLPTETRQERKSASDFRKNIMSDGFTMFQYSVYLRHCGSYESAKVHTERVKKLIPNYGKVTILCITEKQFSLMQSFYGKKNIDQPRIFGQLELF